MVDEQALAPLIEAFKKAFGTKTSMTFDAQLAEIERLKSGEDFDPVALDKCVTAAANAVVEDAMKQLTKDGTLQNAAEKEIVDDLSDAIVAELRKLQPNQPVQSKGGPGEADDWVVPESAYSAVLRTLHTMTRREWSPDGKVVAGGGSDLNELVKRAALTANDKLAAAFYEELRNKQAPLPQTQEAPRVPSEVLVQFQSQVKAAAKDDPGNAALKQLLETSRRLFMTGELTVEQTHAFFEKAAKISSEAGLNSLGALCSDLPKSMPRSSDEVPPTRLHDNIYGRVYDSKLVAALVERPPPGVKSAMDGAKSEMAKVVDGLEAGPLMQLGGKIKNDLKYNDPRFWLPKVSGLEKVRDAKSDKEAGAAVKDYLRSASQTGFDCVATPWLMVKLALGLEDNRPGNPDRYKNVPWKEAGDKNYTDVIGTQTGRESLAKESIKTVGSGITLQHQPSADYDDQWMQASKRPTTMNRPVFEDAKQPAAGDQQPETVSRKPASDSAKTSLEHGRPFASGVSGSTNMLLFNMKHLQDQGANINTKDFLLGAMMFLVYDGGHSVQEVLWTANQLNETLKLGLDLGGDPGQPEAFVADYDRFIAQLEGDSKAALERAAGEAWDGVSQYFDQNSQYARH